MRIIWGIDPGNSGAIVKMAGDGIILGMWDMPLMTKITQSTGKKRISPDVRALGHIFLDSMQVGRSDYVFIERVGPMRKGAGSDAQGSVSTATFMYSVGKLFAALEIHFPLSNIIEVMPSVWKRHFNLLNSEKDAARKLVYAMDSDETRLFKDTIWTADDCFKRKKDIGRADATLIGLYGVYQLQKGAVK